jgi:hypothetical protein
MLRRTCSFVAFGCARVRREESARRTLASLEQQGDGAGSLGETAVSDGQFHRVADATLDLLCERLETLEDEFDDFDLVLSDGVLKLDFGSHGHGSWVRAWLVVAAAAVVARW